MFITFEGIDGSGKTTQLKIFADYLESKGIDFVTFREPGGTIFSEKIRELLLDKDNEISSLTELLLFEAARNHLVDKLIRPALEQNKIVLCDRFYDSTTAYQGWGRQLDLDMVRVLNSIATNGLQPDLTYYLKLPLDEAKNRSKSRNIDRIESGDDGFFERIMLGFEHICENEPNRCFIIDSQEEKSIVHNRIVEIFEKKIGIR